MLRGLCKLFRMLGCAVRGHHYLPSYTHSYVKEAWYLPRTEETMTYECDDCGEHRTVRAEDHEAFLKTHCPTWGGRGSDSQGHKRKD